MGYAKKTVVLKNTELSPIVGKVGYEFTLPTDILKKGYVFEGWYADSEFKNEFTQKKFAEEEFFSSNVI